MDRRTGWAATIWCALALIVAASTSHAETLSGAPESDWDEDDMDTRPPALQFGCGSQDNCLLGPQDVEHLPDRGGSLGVKTVAIGPLQILGEALYFHTFEIYDVSAGPSNPAPIPQGSRITYVDRLLFHDVPTLQRYIRSRQPGQMVSVSLLAPGSQDTTTMDMVVVDARYQRYVTPFPEFITSQQFAQIASNQNFYAMLGAAKDIAPYALLFGLGSGDISAIPNACKILDVEC